MFLVAVKQLQNQIIRTMKTSSRSLPTRVVLYPKDVENITGRRGSTARRLIQKIREALGKSKDEFITIKEFALFTGIDEELIKDFLQQ
jgi:ribosomal protein S3